MLRQASSRNQRTKGFRVKHALQMFLLVAVCVWLLYQVKHSRDKKIAFEEQNSKILSKVVESEPDFFKFGRKDLPRSSEDTSSVNETDNKEEENKEAQEEEQQEETEDEEGRGAGDDEIDEQDQGKSDEEDEHGEELAEEEDNDGQVDEIDFFDNQDHEGGTQEAREENYKRDDASSAVVHDTHTTEPETGNGDARSSNDEQIDGMEEKVAEAENVDNASDAVVRENVTMPDDNLSTNSTTAENRELEAESSKLDNKSVSISTMVEHNNQGELQTNSTTTESNDQLELPTNSTASISNDRTEAENNSTVVDSVTSGVPLQNGTVSVDSVQDRNATVDKGTHREDEPNSENVVVEPTEKLELEEQSTTSSSTNENEDAAQGETDGSSHGMVTEEEKDARTDLSTLPDIQNEVAKNVDDEAAE